ncbi:MAG TPA: crosslink repair DNA glycosylase YcaQ family protein, partial [Ktedonobacterales bacterium]|nr:crosslink repair DNA glycosylase YcaQ family protein [Ktedonobacterales bacterium]
DYRYYRLGMLRAVELHMWAGDRTWLERNPEALQRTLDTIRERGPMTSSQFERAPEGQRGQAWDWYGPKESRRALAVAWMLGDLMIHSRRAGQKVYDLRERVLAEAFGDGAPGDDELPTPGEQLRYFTRRTVQALGVVTSTWLLDYFRIRPYLRPNGNGGDAGKNGNSRAAALTLLEELAREGVVAPVRVEGLSELAYLAVERLPDLERLRSGEAPARTTLLAPFDSLIWDRARTRALFDYEVSFEAYVLPAKRRYGYYCLAILHHGRLVGRVDTKAQRDERTLLARAVYLEQGIVADDALLDGLAGALGDLARFLKLEAVRVERSEPAPLAKQLSTRVAGKVASQRARAAKARRAAPLA